MPMAQWLETYGNPTVLAAGGAMIGGLVAMTLDRSILRQLGAGRRIALVSGTNGKSTTTGMLAAALRTLGPVATNSEGANMDAGLVAAVWSARGASEGSRIVCANRSSGSASKRGASLFDPHTAFPVCPFMPW